MTNSFLHNALKLTRSINGFLFSAFVVVEGLTNVVRSAFYKTALKFWSISTLVHASIVLIDFYEVG